MVTIQKQFAVVCFTAQGIYVSLLCLPTGDSSVLKESGEVISMAELRVDDRVLAGRKAYVDATVGVDHNVQQSLGELDDQRPR